MITQKIYLETLLLKISKLDELNLESTFSNNKKMNLSIETNKQKETITRLITNHPKPLIKRYNFIKGFDEGYLRFSFNKKRWFF